MGVTGETITDEQIREVWNEVDANAMAGGHRVIAWCRSAIFGVPLHGSTIHVAKGHCADAYNALKAER